MAPNNNTLSAFFFVLMLAFCVAKATPYVNLALEKYLNLRLYNGSTPDFSDDELYTFTGNRKWPSQYLSYSYDPENMPPAAPSQLKAAFDEWAAASRYFQFSQAKQGENANLKITFVKLDGPGNLLGRALPPTDGRSQFDADEAWTVGAVQGKVDLKTIFLHEFGHLLGLGHSKDPAAVMYTPYTEGTAKNLQKDDIEGIRAFYNVN